MWLLNPEDLLGRMQCELVEGLVDSCWLAGQRLPTWSNAELGYGPSLPQVDPYLPYEYTCSGMLERINAYIQHQVGHPVSPDPGAWGCHSKAYHFRVRAMLVPGSL